MRQPVERLDTSATMGARDPRTPRRVSLAGAWAVFLVIWFPATLFVLALSGVVCGGDGGTPYYDPASPQGGYCETVGDYWSWGEPGALHAVPFLLPIVIPIAIGVVGVWRRSAPVLKRGAIALSVASLLYLIVPFVLPG